MKKKPLKLNISWDMKPSRPTGHYNGELIFDYNTQKLLMYADDSWVEFCDKPDDALIEKQKNCPNCGAPHNPNSNYCEYCGTFF